MKKIFIRNYYFVIKLSTDFILYEGDFGVRVESVFHIGEKINNFDSKSAQSNFSPGIGQASEQSLSVGIMKESISFVFANASMI